MKKDIAITTLSWIRNDEESKVVLATIEELNKLDIPIIVFDKSAPAYREKIQAFSNILWFEGNMSHTQQLIKSHQEAAKHALYLLYLQTDKLNFAKNYARKMIDSYFKLKEQGMYIASRKNESIETYPKYQKQQEAFLNFFMSDYIGIKEDYYSGIKIMPSVHVSTLEHVKGEIGWGIEAYLYVLAKRMNMPFQFFPFFMKAPTDVDDEFETKLYRLKVTQGILEGFMQGIRR